MYSVCSSWEIWELSLVIKLERWGVTFRFNPEWGHVSVTMATISRLYRSQHYLSCLALSGSENRLWPPRGDQSELGTKTPPGQTLLRYNADIILLWTKFSGHDGSRGERFECLHWFESGVRPWIQFGHSLLSKGSNMTMTRHLAVVSSRRANHICIVCTAFQTKVPALNRMSAYALTSSLFSNFFLSSALA